MIWHIQITYTCYTYPHSNVLSIIDTNIRRLSANRNQSIHLCNLLQGWEASQLVVHTPPFSILQLPRNSSRYFTIKNLTFLIYSRIEENSSFKGNYNISFVFFLKFPVTQ